MADTLEARIASIPNLREIRQADELAAFERGQDGAAAGLDGVAHYVFNTLRGSDNFVYHLNDPEPRYFEDGSPNPSFPSIAPATYDTIRGLVAARGA